jgi:dedicator of cytokinesis protein 3
MTSIDLANYHLGFEVAFFQELSILTPLNMAPAMLSPTDSWVAAVTARSLASPTPDDYQMNGSRVNSPMPNGRPARQDKKRLSLAFLTKGVLMGEPDKEKESKADKQSMDEYESSSASSTRSVSKDAGRNRLSLSFLHANNPATPNSPAPEALPAFTASNNASQSNISQTSLGRTASQSKRSETGKSGKSDGSMRGSVKKRLSFMNISKKSSKSSVRGRAPDTLVEE